MSQIVEVAAKKRQVFGSLAQASDLIRKLVDKIVVTPVEEKGRNSLSIDLHGHLAGILSLTTKAKRPLHESGLEIGCMNWLRGQDLNL